MPTRREEEHRGKGRPRAFEREEALRAALKVFWEKGYQTASVAELCKAMAINPPSLYCSFGNKSALFIEAAHYYERLYWDEPARRFMAEKNIYLAVKNFFDESAEIILSPETPCGCMVVLAAINIAEDEKEVIAAISEMRQATKKMFAERLRQAIKDGQIPPDTDVPALSGVLNTLLEGMSLQAKDGIFQSELKAIGAYAARLLPCKHSPASGDQP